MTKNKKNSVFLISLVILPIVIYTLFPLHNGNWSILPNKELQTGKAEYLKSLAGSRFNTDSLPNIILILADDLGVNDLSYKGNKNIQTPNIDYLARNGIQFENAYCASSVCSSSRAALLTGRYHNRFGFQYQMQNRYARNRLMLWAMRKFVKSDPWILKPLLNPPSKQDVLEQGLPNSEISFAEIIKYGAEYKTALLGKWHLGKKKGKIPKDFGFDYHYGFYNSHSLYIQEDSDDYVDLKNDKDWTDKYIWKDQRMGLSAIVRNDTVIQEDRYLTDRITEETIAFIKQNKTHRFFALVSYNAPHTPLQAPKKTFDDFSFIKDPVKRVYAAMIKNMDENIGKIHAFLKKEGLSENTLIIFTSDNGGARYTLTTDNYPYKGGKVNYFEGGLRVPLIVYQDGKIPPISSDQRVSTMDIFATIALVTDLPAPYDRVIDGIALPLESHSSVENDRTLHWAAGKTNAMIWKDYKIIYSNSKNKPVRLYKLSNDYTEKHNLSTQHSQLVQKLIQKQEAWRSGMPPPLWPGVIEYSYIDEGETILFE